MMARHRSGWPESTVPMTGGPSMQEVEVEGLTIAFERRGEGSPLVLLHGGLSDHREWRRQLDALSDAFTIVAWDAPGCGNSSDPPETFRLPDYADRLAGLIRALGLERPHVLGLSWGSTLALELYRRHPDLPRTLVLTAAYAGWAGSLTPEEVARRLETSLRDLDTMDPEAFVRNVAPNPAHRASTGRDGGRTRDHHGRLPSDGTPPDAPRDGRGRSA